MRTRRLVAGVTALALSMGLVAGCVPSERDPNTIVIAIHSGFEEGIAASHLWKSILEEDGFKVEMTTADPGPVYVGLAAGQYDVNFDVWLPTTHGDYIEQYGDRLTDLGAWFDKAQLTIVVNEDAPITSLDELNEHADEFNNKLVGIEPGAGLTRITKESVVPGYKLTDIDFVESSTPAMLAEVSGSIAAGKNVVATLWSPHWAYAAFPIRDLEDPKGLLGKAEQIHAFSRSDFAKEKPELDKLMRAFTMTEEELSSLEEIMFNEFDGKNNDKAVQQWLKANPDYVSELRERAAKG